MSLGASSPRRELEELVTAFCDAFNRDDLEAVMGYFAEDALYETFDGHLARGRAAIRAAFEPPHSLAS